MIEVRGTIDERQVGAESDTAVYFVEFWRSNAWVDVQEVESDAVLDVVAWARDHASQARVTRVKISLVAPLRADNPSAQLHAFACHEEYFDG